MTAKERARDIYFAMLNEGKGYISDYLALEYAKLFVSKQNERDEEIFHKYGIGFMGSAESRNDYSKSAMGKYWKNVEKELMKL